MSITSSIISEITSSIISDIIPKEDFSLPSGFIFKTDASDPASIGTPSNGDPITTWIDTAGGNNLAGSTIKPTFLDSDFNDQPAVKFSLANSTYFESINPFLDPASTDFEVFVVGSFANETATSEFLLQQADGTGLGRTILFKEGSGRIRSTIGDTSGNFVSYRPQIYNLSNTGNDFEIYTNGLLAQSDTRVKEAANGSLIVGTVKDKNASFLDGTINHILIYPRKLTQSERSQVNAYLANKWKIKDYILPIIDSSLALNLMAYSDDILKDDLMTVDESNFASTWKAKRANTLINAEQLVGGAQPLFSTAIINGRPALSFDAVNDYLRGEGLGITGSQASTIFVVFKKSTTTLTSERVFEMGKETNSTNGATRALDVSDVNNTSGFRFNDGNRLFNEDVAVNGEYIMTGVNASGANYGQHDRYLNGVLSTESSTSNPTNVPNLVDDEYLVGIGRNSAGTLAFGFKGWVGEIIVYGRELSTAERQLVESYLSNKWGITLT